MLSRINICHITFKTWITLPDSSRSRDQAQGCMFNSRIPIASENIGSLVPDSENEKPKQDMTSVNMINDYNSLMSIPQRQKSSRLVNYKPRDLVKGCSFSERKWKLLACLNPKRCGHARRKLTENSVKSFEYVGDTNGNIWTNSTEMYNHCVSNLIRCF